MRLRYRKRVKGGELRVGDLVLIPARIVEINRWKHPIAKPESPWNAGDQRLWTWGGEHGSGIDRPPDITLVKEFP